MCICGIENQTNYEIGIQEGKLLVSSCLFQAEPDHLPWCGRLALSVCSVSGLEQALRVSISPGGSSYLQPSARPGNNTCIGLPWASHLTSLPHYNDEPCSPAGALGPAGNSCPGGRKGKRQLSFPGKKRLGLGMNVQDPALPAACWVSIIKRCSVTALYSQSSLPHQRETRLVTVREPVCS